MPVSKRYRISLFRAERRPGDNSVCVIYDGKWPTHIVECCGLPAVLAQADRLAAGAGLPGTVRRDPRRRRGREVYRDEESFVQTQVGIVELSDRVLMRPLRHGLGKTPSELGDCGEDIGHCDLQYLYAGDGWRYWFENPNRATSKIINRNTIENTEKLRERGLISEVDQ